MSDQQIVTTVELEVVELDPNTMFMCQGLATGELDDGTSVEVLTTVGLGGLDLFIYGTHPSEGEAPARGMRVSLRPLVGAMIQARARDLAAEEVEGR